jgi:methylated-DNA-[protein]-cysteine S-methyltransferase
VDRPEWDRRVLSEVRQVGWGRTASYGDIARRVGMPRAARAVGGALGRNPISLLIPCHRIIAADGTLGGYGGTGWVDRDRQLSRKEALLLREGVAVPRRGD